MIEIIATTSQDLALIRQLAEQTFHVTYLPLQPKGKVDYLFDLMYHPSSLEEQMQNGQKFIVAKDETGYLGYASYELNYAGLEITKIHKIYILPTAQGKGVGKQLIAHITSIARKNKNGTLSLNVYRKNPALGFYQKLSFNKVDEVDIDVGNGFTMNDFVMEKSIG